MSAPQIEDDEESRIVVDIGQSQRRAWFRGYGNRRLTVTRFSLLAWLAGPLAALGARLLVLGKVLAVLGAIAGAVLAGRQVVRHVIASPRFQVRELRITPTRHVTGDEIRSLLGVRPGNPLLAVDPDAVAAALTKHPWIASARVRRDLPGTLAVDVVERRANATALIGSLYLLDEAGRPFKRATPDEADGLPVVTGVTREQYAAMRATSEAVFRDSLALLETYKADSSTRPKLSEVHVDPRSGFSLVLLDGGGEIRLGRGDFPAKLARLDRIVAALDARGPAALRTVYLDGPLADRVTLRLAEGDATHGSR